MNYKELSEKMIEKAIKRLEEIDISGCDLDEIIKFVSVLSVVRLCAPIEYPYDINTPLCEMNGIYKEDSNA